MSEDLLNKHPPPKCERCSQTTSLLYSFLDPNSGRRVRTYKCSCGEQIVVPDTRPN